MAPSRDEVDQARSAGHDVQDVEGEGNEWKFKDPYRIHDKEGAMGGFKALYEGHCHCGRVKFQLSRERPLESKFCHCGTCQVLHGKQGFYFRSGLWGFRLGLGRELLGKG